MPEAYPDHLEAGTQNAPGIAGLTAALDWLLARGVDSLRAKEMELKSRLVRNLLEIPGVTLCSPVGEKGVGIVTLLVDGMQPDEVAHVLENRFGISGRAGLHCAPEAHGVLGTLDSGAYRVLLGWATTAEDVDHAADALRTLTREIRNR
jgi:selenocysteine lyase/cysteine desulfurase